LMRTNNSLTDIVRPHGTAITSAVHKGSAKSVFFAIRR
jgi:hypothetical protein